MYPRNSFAFKNELAFTIFDFFFRTMSHRRQKLMFEDSESCGWIPGLGENKPRPRKFDYYLIILKFEMPSIKKRFNAHFKKRFLLKTYACVMLRFYNSLFAKCIVD